MKNTILILTLFLASTTHATTKVAVIDTGFDFTSQWSNNATIKATGLTKPKLCPTGHYDFVNDSDKMVDNHGHGTHIAGLIAKGNKDIDYCLVILKYYDPKVPNTDNLKNSIKSYRRAVDLHVDIINYSGGGTDRSEEECSILKEALDKGIKVVAAAGNERSDLDRHPYYPALCDSRITVVVSTDNTGDRLPSSNWSTKKYKTITEHGRNVLSLLPYNSYGLMTGTSQATAIITSKLVKEVDEFKKLHTTPMRKPLKSHERFLASIMQYKIVRSCNEETN